MVKESDKKGIRDIIPWLRGSKEKMRRRDFKRMHVSDVVTSLGKTLDASNLKISASTEGGVTYAIGGAEVVLPIISLEISEEYGKEGEAVLVSPSLEDEIPPHSLKINLKAVPKEGGVRANVGIESLPIETLESISEKDLVRLHKVGVNSIGDLKSCSVKKVADRTGISEDSIRKYVGSGKRVLDAVKK